MHKNYMKVWGAVEIMIILKPFSKRTQPAPVGAVLVIIDKTKEVYDNYNNFEKEIRNFVERWDSKLVSEDDDFGLDLLIENTHLKEERWLSRFSFLSANLFR